jgi:hypothetical protein
VRATFSRISISGMTATFRIRHSWVNGIDEETSPFCAEHPPSTMIPFFVEGFLREGVVRPGMFIRIRPSSPTLPLFRIENVEELPWDESSREFHEQAAQFLPDMKDAIGKSSITLTLRCSDREQFRAIREVNPQHEDAVLFER